MALPKVTPGTYDYGAYAKPTMVRYKGGQEAIGKAIGGAIEKGIESFNKRKGEIKAAEDWKTDTVFKLTSEIDSETLAQNEIQIKNLTNEIGELGRLKMLGKIPGEEYTKRMVDLNNTFKSYRILGTDIFEAALEGEIDMTQFKGEDLDRNAGFNRAVSSGNLKTNFDPKTGKATATWTGASGKEFTANLNDIVNNAKDYLKLDQRFDFRDADKQDILQAVANKVNSSKDIRNYMTDEGQSASGKFEVLNKELATKGISQSNFIDGFVNQYGKDIFEDVVKPGYENVTGSELNIDYKSPEAQQMIREVVAGQVVGRVQQTGDKIPEPKAEPKPDKPAKWEIDMAELKQEQEKLLTNPISQRQWDNVVKPRPSKSYEGGADGQSTASLDDMSLTAMSQLASKYDFTIVGEPLLDKAGTKEIGFELQDNKTKEKIRIYKSFTIDQVMEELKKAKNVSDSNKVRLP